MKFTRVSDDCRTATAGALVGLNHRHLARVYSVGVLGRYAVTEMEYVSGRTWHRLLEDRGPLPESIVAWLGWQAASALARLHACGLLHRDVQPRNLLIDRRSIVKLIDFDLVEALSNEIPNCVVGTPDYVAPEQVTAAAPLTGQTDFYSLGCTLFHLLTGRPPFVGASQSPAARILAHVRQPVPEAAKYASEVSPAMNRLLTAMLEKSPDRRPAAHIVIGALRQIARGCPQGTETIPMYRGRIAADTAAATSVYRRLRPQRGTVLVEEPMSYRLTAGELVLLTTTNGMLNPQ